MQYRTFGPTNRQLSAIGMGVMPLSTDPDRPDEDEAIGVIHHAIDCGINLLDTADSYCFDDTETGHNERLIGKAMAKLSPTMRQEIVVATKGGWLRPQGRWEPCGTPRHLRRQCEQSLVNLGVERIDVYQYHTIDPNVPLLDSIGELKLLQDEGRIEHVGVSNFTVDQLDEARSILEIVSVQNQYSLQVRRPEKDGTLSGSAERGVSFIPWSPLGGREGAKSLDRDQPVVKSIARRRGVSVQQIILAWLLSKGPMVFPIPGSKRKQTIEDSAKAASLTLSSDETAQIDG